MYHEVARLQGTQQAHFEDEDGEDGDQDRVERIVGAVRGISRHPDPNR